MEKETIGRFRELRNDANMGFLSSVKTEGVHQGAIVNMHYCKAIGEAVLKNKKFQAVLEYDPEADNALFYIKFDEPGIHLEV